MQFCLHFSSFCFHKSWRIPPHQQMVRENVIFFLCQPRKRKLSQLCAVPSFGRLFTHSLCKPDAQSEHCVQNFGRIRVSKWTWYILYIVWVHLALEKSDTCQCPRLTAQIESLLCFLVQVESRHAQEVSSSERRTFCSLGSVQVFYMCRQWVHPDCQCERISHCWRRFRGVLLRCHHCRVCPCHFGARCCPTQQLERGVHLSDLEELMHFDRKLCSREQSAKFAPDEKQCGVQRVQFLWKLVQSHFWSYACEHSRQFPSWSPSADLATERLHCSAWGLPSHWQAVATGPNRSDRVWNFRFHGSCQRKPRARNSGRSRRICVDTAARTDLPDFGRRLHIPT